MYRLKQAVQNIIHKGLPDIADVDQEVTFDANVHKIDEVSLAILPDDCPDGLVPVAITADGDCLPRLLSTAYEDLKITIMK